MYLLGAIIAFLLVLYVGAKDKKYDTGDVLIAAIVAGVFSWLSLILGVAYSYIEHIRKTNKDKL